MINTVDLIKKYKAGESNLVALSNVNLNIEEGEFVAVYGPSGCGKTSLFNILGLIEEPTGGKLYFGGEDVSQLNEGERLKCRKGKVGFVFCDPMLIDELTVAENVGLPLLYENMGSKERKKRVAELLGKMNLTHRKNHFPKDLDGFQQQKISVARALINRPGIILADEPTGYLNSTDGEAILNMLVELNEQGVTMALFTHSQHVANKAQRIIQLHDGHVVSENLKINFDIK